jgi:hypothetical protein
MKTTIHLHLYYKHTKLPCMAVVQDRPQVHCRSLREALKAENKPARTIGTEHLSRDLPGVPDVQEGAQDERSPREELEQQKTNPDTARTERHGISPTDILKEDKHTLTPQAEQPRQGLLHKF